MEIIVLVPVTVVLLLLTAAGSFNLGYAYRREDKEVLIAPSKIESPLTRDEALITLRAARETDDLESFVDTLMQLPPRQPAKRALQCQWGGCPGCDGPVTHRVGFSKAVPNENCHQGTYILCRMHTELAKTKSWIDCSQELEALV